MGCPIVKNWIDEGKQFLPALNLVDPTKRSGSSGPVDVYVTTTSVLQRDSPTRRFIAKIPFKYTFVDEAHHWVRGKRGGEMAEQLRFFRDVLLRKVDANWLLSGTIFPGNIRFDFIETIKSLACPQRRDNWQVIDGEGRSFLVYGDSELQLLSKDWESTHNRRKTEMLVPLMLLRTEDTMIDGEPAMNGHMSMLEKRTDGEISYALIKKEITDRQNAIRSVEENTKIRYNLGRLYSYSSQVLERHWSETGRFDSKWWDKFTLADAKQFARGRQFVFLLSKLKKEKRKPIVFAYAVFHQQWGAHVFHLSSLSNC
jgi:hypothetical protein